MTCQLCYDFGWIKTIFKKKKAEAELSDNGEVSQPEYKVAEPEEPHTTDVASEGSSAPPVPVPAEPPTTGVVSEGASVLVPAQHTTIAVAPRKASAPPAAAITQKSKTQEDRDIVIAYVSSSSNLKMLDMRLTWC